MHWYSCLPSWRLRRQPILSMGRLVQQPPIQHTAIFKVGNKGQTACNRRLTPSLQYALRVPLATPSTSLSWSCSRPSLAWLTATFCTRLKRNRSSRYSPLLATMAAAHAFPSSFAFVSAHASSPTAHYGCRSSSSILKRWRRLCWCRRCSCLSTSCALVRTPCSAPCQRIVPKRCSSHIAPQPSLQQYRAGLSHMLHACSVPVFSLGAPAA